MKKMAMLLLLLGVGLTAYAQSNGNGGNGTNGNDTFKPNILPELVVPEITSAIVVDGDLSDPAWQQAGRATNFSETFPGDQTKPPIGIETWVAYDETHIYFAFIIEDDPSTIRASLRDRDQIWQDDYVGVLLDSYGTEAWGQFFFSNPLGIQGDSRIVVGQGEEDSFNLIYDSSGKITETGYQVEMAVPFRSLRFPDRDEQAWRATFWITHPRDNRTTYSWAAINRDNNCFSCDWGTLRIPRKVEGNRGLELLPALVGSQSGALDTFTDPTSFNNGKVTADPSLTMKYAIGSKVTADLAINPDFSQVEADAAQVDVNSTFALFFQEQRPFFQEGGDVFQTWVNTVYTRSINNPAVAGKVTARFDRLSIGYIGGLDEDSPIILPFEERSAVLQGGRSFSNIFRMRQTIGQRSHIGGLITDRRLDGGGSGTTLSLDGLVRFGPNTQLELQYVFSHTAEPDDGTLTDGRGLDGVTFGDANHTAVFDGESFWGNAAYGSFEHNTRTWGFDVDYRHTSPTFRADNGFITSANQRSLSVWSGLFFYPQTKLISRLTPMIIFGREWNMDGLWKDNWIMGRINAGLIGQTNFNAGFVWGPERFRGIEFHGMWNYDLFVQTNAFEIFRPGMSISGGKGIARNLSTPVRGNSRNINFFATIKPLQNVVIEPRVSFSRLKSDAGEEIFDGYIFRTRLSYQFTRELFLRLVTQYNNFSGRLDIDPLLTYKINAFTAFYLGSTYDFFDYDRINTPEPYGFERTNRQFFFKFQYLVRM